MYSITKVKIKKSYYKIVEDSLEIAICSTKLSAARLLNKLYQLDSQDLVFSLY
jgi:hypothetical protein